MLTCREITELVTDYMEGRLPFVQRLRFRIHLLLCGPCRPYLDQMRITVAVLGVTAGTPVPAATREALLASFRALSKKNRPAQAPVPWSLRVLAWLDRYSRGGRGWAIAGALLVLVVAGLLAGDLQPGPLRAELGCLLSECASAAVGLVGLATLAWIHGCGLSSPTFVVVSMSGSLVGFAALQATCEFSRVAPHALVVHVGGIVLAGAVGFLVSRLPTWRWRDL